MISESAKSISVIVPVRNEEDRVRESIHKLLTYFKEGWDFELIFVQDNSTDNTSSIIEELSLSDSRIKLMNIPIRVGKGGAIMCSANACTKKNVAYLDVDLSGAPCELEKLLKHISNYDIVIGSRLLRGDLIPIKRSFHRSLLSRSYSKLFRVLFRIPIIDPQCGFKLIRREAILKLFQDVMITDFTFDTDLIVTACAQGLRIKEVPINWEESKVSSISIPREIRDMGIGIISIWYRYHLLWRQGKACYPQKKGSIFGKVSFKMLSLSNSIKKRHMRYLQGQLLAISGTIELEPIQAPLPNSL